MPLELPTGPRGQILAAALTTIVAAFLWLGVIAPLRDWNADLADTRTRRETLAGRMRSLAETLPTLQRQSGAQASPSPALASMEGATDAVAAASLQEKIQDMARKAGVTLSSAEALPVDAVGPYRRIGLRLSVEGRWPMLIAFLQSTGQATPRMLIDDVQLQRGPILLGADKPLLASLTIFGFRAGP